MIQLVDSLDIAMDWSDHAIWWPSQNKWLDKTRWTLDQYNVNADTVIHFTPMHKTLRIQLPDLRYIDCTVDFSVKTFNASVGMCKDLGLRHPEELSLCKPLDPEHLRQIDEEETTPAHQGRQHWRQTGHQHLHCTERDDKRE